MSMNKVYALLFNAGTNNEGIYAISQNRNDTVIVFETVADAQHHARLLVETDNFPLATVEAMNTNDICEFCDNAGYEIQLVEAGRYVKENTLATNGSTPDPSIVYSVLADDAVDYLLNQLQDKFGISIPGSERSGLSKIVFGTAMELAFQQGQPIARTIIKSSIRQAIAILTDDIVVWLTNFVVRANDEDALATLMHWGVKSTIKIFRTVMLEIYLDEQIDKINARFGWNL